MWVIKDSHEVKGLQVMCEWDTRRLGVVVCKYSQGKHEGWISSQAFRYIYPALISNSSNQQVFTRKPTCVRSFLSWKSGMGIGPSVLCLKTGLSEVYGVCNMKEFRVGEKMCILCLLLFNCTL